MTSLTFTKRGSFSDSPILTNILYSFTKTNYFGLLMLEKLKVWEHWTRERLNAKKHVPINKKLQCYDQIVGRLRV